MLLFNKLFSRNTPIYGPRDKIFVCFCYLIKIPCFNFNNNPSKFLWTVDLDPDLDLDIETDKNTYFPPLFSQF